MHQAASNRRVGLKLVAVTIVMFGFGFALVPLYDLICEVTGFNGRTADGPTQVSGIQADTSRSVTVEFVANVAANAPWEFRPAVSKLKVQPGRMYQTTFYARNLVSSARTAQAVPSVAPGRAARHFNKTECFCFTSQSFAPGEGKQMPLAFMVSPDLPKDVNTLTLSYTFFEAKVKSNGRQTAQNLNRDDLNREDLPRDNQERKIVERGLGV